jgi:transposase
LVGGPGHTFPPDTQKIHSYVERNYPNYAVSLAYEVGCCGYEPARAFISFGWDTFVLNPADIPRPAKNNFVKTDKIDAKNVAKQLRSGNLRKLTIPEKPREALRCLTRQRTALVRDYRRIKSRIKSLLLYHQIHVPPDMETPKWPIKFLDWLKELSFENANTKFTLDSMLNQYRFIDAEIKSVSNMIRAYCKKHYKVDYNLLRSIPGIARLTAAYILAELGDLRRFSSFKKFASYIGFVPGIQQSGDNIYNTGATPRANRHVRNMIVEASWIAIRTDPVMQNYYRSHAGKNSKAVIFKVGRKLLSKLLSVIKTEAPYTVGVISKLSCTTHCILIIGQQNNVRGF